MYDNDYKLLEKNEELSNKVAGWLIEKGISPHLKGFKMLVDIIVLVKLKKKYSLTTIKELSPFIGHKYGVKDYSVQRQLRYTCTLATNRSYKPIELVSMAWYEIEN